MVCGPSKLELQMLNGRNYDLDYKSVDPAKFRRRMRYASFVCAQHRLLYIETPKAACTSLKWVMAELAGKTPVLTAMGFETQLEMTIHFRDIHPLPALTDLPRREAEQVLKGDGYLRFCAVRNPYTRLIAAWSNKIRQIEPGYGETCAAIRVFHGDRGVQRAPSFREFALWVVSTCDPDASDGHWRPQFNLLHPQIIDYDFVLKTESLGADLQKVFDASPTLQRADARSMLSRFRYNESLPFAQANLYDEDLARRVASYYKDDFEVFGYDLDSWRNIVDRRPLTFSELEAASLSAIQNRNALIEALVAKKSKKSTRVLTVLRKLIRT